MKKILTLRRHKKPLTPDERADAIQSNEKRRRSIIEHAQKPRTRKRSLTVPLEQPSADQRTVDQAACWLFQLPFEIREQILHEVLVEDGPIWLFLFAKAGFGLERSRFLLREQSQQPSGSRVNVDNFESPKDGMINLLVTCRHLYVECLDIIYGVNTFAFTEVASFLSFAGGIPRCRLSQIRKLELDIVFPYLLLPERTDKRFDQTHVREWDTTFALIDAAMPNLVQLHVGICTRSYRQYMPGFPIVPEKLKSEMLWRPLLAIKHIRDFSVTVSWPLEEYDAPADAPFRMDSSYEDEESSVADSASLVSPT